MMNVFEKIISQVEAELESSEKFMREYDDSIAQKAYYNGMAHILYIIQKEVKEHNNGWIPCSERLPSMEECYKDDNRFIVSDGNRSYQRFFDYKEKRFCEPFYRGTLNTFYDDCVTHWQPLPKPYKERDTNGN